MKVLLLCFFLNAFGYRLRPQFRERVMQGCPTWESKDPISGSPCSIQGQTCQQVWDPCYCPADKTWPEAYMVYPGLMTYTCNPSHVWFPQGVSGVDGACGTPCEDQPICGPGQVASFLPQPGVSVNQPRSQSFLSISPNCGTNISDCYICAPPNPITTSPPSNSTIFNISIHCKNAPKQAWAFSGTYSGSAMINKADFIGPSADLQVLVSASGKGVGTVRFEWCENNHYGSYLASFQASTSPPPPTTLAPPPTESRVTPPTSSPVATPPKTCAAGQQAYFLPQPTNQLPKEDRAPFLTCKTAGLTTSKCQICSPNPVNPRPVKNPAPFMISILCGKQILHADWQGYSMTSTLTIDLKGNFSDTPPKNFTASLTGVQGDYGWLRIEWCDLQDKHGQWFIPLGSKKAMKS